MKLNNKGQSMVEYLILVAMIAIGSFSVVQILGKNLKMRLSDVSDTLAGKSGERKLEGIMVKEEQYGIKDLGDFNEGIEDTSRE